MMFCNRCGTMLEDTDQFCPMCGNGVERDGKHTDEKAEEKSQSKKEKIFITVLSILLFVSVVFNVVQIVFSGENQSNDEAYSDIETVRGDYDEIVDKAINALSDKWIEIYFNDEKTDGYLEIIHTRFIDITPDKNDSVFQEIDRAMEIDYIIEFSLYSDYFSASPYYHNAAIYDTVVVYNDGTSLVAGNLFRTYSNLTYSYDYSGFIEEIVDLGSLYNQQIRLY